MQKRGQVTVFIIVGIIMLAVFSLILFITSNLKVDELESADEF